MKRFILRFILFLVLGYLLGEVVVRYYKLTSDVPHRYVDTHGLQLYEPGQTGYFKGASEPWTVNEFGWLGINTIENKNRRISIIGDSYIENIMNPDNCNQGYLLQELNPEVGFFEAGRSGVTFIEALEIAQKMDSLDFDEHLIYVTDADFTESFANKTRYADRLQVDLDRNIILKGELKSPGLKKILYNLKFMYYLYLRFPLFVGEQNKGEIAATEDFDRNSFDRLFAFCQSNYDLRKITLIFHPETSDDIVSFFKEKGLRHIRLVVQNGKSWDLNAADGHWSCLGHAQAARQITAAIIK
ncbi:MAG: hypothetical protein HKO94_04430 [Flavobacteriaceae bacterium]|nr:hypothetical protein [Flavobacteriaceae bacterium]